MKSNKGFTLIELLFVLVIVSIISLLVLPSMFHTLTKQETNHFLQTFESDVFLTQNQSLYTLTNDRILLEKNYYIVRNDGKNILRSNPHHLELSSPTTRIRFSMNGTIVDPTTYRFKDQHGIYRIVFPFGKGRFYIDEE